MHGERLLSLHLYRASDLEYEGVPLDDWRILNSQAQMAVCYMYLANRGHAQHS